MTAEDRGQWLQAMRAACDAHLSRPVPVAGPGRSYGTGPQDHPGPLSYGPAVVLVASQDRS